MIEVPGTELDEIQEEVDNFSDLVEKHIVATVDEVVGSIGEVIVAQGSAIAASPDDLNGIPNEWRRRLNLYLLPRIETLADAGIRAQAAALSQALGFPVLSAFDSTVVTRIVLDTAANRLQDIGDDVWETARSALSLGVSEGESIADIRNRIRESVDVGVPRATSIARTEVIGAANKSSLELMKATGLVAQKRWIATFDDRVRLSHIDAHGQVVGLDEPFDVGGTSLEHPGDFGGEPEEVINCRCAMGYVVDEDVSDLDALTAADRQHSSGMIALVPTEEDQARLALEDGEPADEIHLTLYFLGDADDWSTEAREALVNALSTYDWPHADLDTNAFGLAHWNPFGDSPCWVLNVGGGDLPDVRATVDDQLSKLGSEVLIPEIPEQHTPWSAHVCLTYTDDTSQALIDQLKERVGPVDFDRLRVAFGGDNVDIPLRSGTMSTKASALESTVDWFIEKNHEECPEGRPWAVVKASDNSLEGCHETREEATAQLRAILEAQAKERDEQREREIESTVGTKTSAQTTAKTFQEEAPCPPGQHRMPDGDCMPDVDMTAFEGVAVVEGQWTGDGRQFAPDSLTWENLDEVIVSLQWQKESNHGGINDVTVNVGRLTSLERSGAEIKVAGYIDGGSEDGAEAIRRIKAGTLGGVSIVADDPEQSDVEFVYPEGCDDLEEKTPEEIDQIPIEELDRCFMPNGIIFHGGRIRALTLVDTPAFVEASIHIVESEDDGDEDNPFVVSNEFGTVNKRGSFDFKEVYKQLPELDMTDPKSIAEVIDELEPLLAASHAIVIQDVPPAEWFEEPTQLPPFGALTVTDEGRVYGLLAPREVAHRSYTDKRVTVPTGNVDYSRWMNRETIVQGGQRIMTGPITMDCGHAATNGQNAQHSQDHYDNACSVVATVRIGESKRGVWVAGALVSGVTSSQVARMLACALSGDWRKHRDKPGMRELTGALLVPVPGFPMSARRSLRVDEGELVASTVPVTWKLTGDLPESDADEPITAAVIGSTDLPVADRDTDWDGSGARQRVFDLCTSGESVDVDCVSRAFLWRDPDQDADNMGAYSLGFADVINDTLQIVPRGVAATAGGRGVDAADIPSDAKDTIKNKICTLYNRIQDKFDDWPDCPFSSDSAESEVDDTVDASSNGHGKYNVDDVPSWEDVQRLRALREQTDELTKRLEQELGIEIGV